MKVILKEEVISLGKPGEIINVTDGYARNYLFPKKKAMPATQGNLKNLDQFKKTLMKKHENQQALAQDLAQKLSGVTCTIQRKVGEKDKLFGSVTSNDIYAALKEKGYEIDKRGILLHEPIRELGEHEVEIRLSTEVSTKIKVSVQAEA